VEESPQGYAAPKPKSKPADQSKSSEPIPHPDEVESAWAEMPPDMNENLANFETQSKRNQTKAVKVDQAS
jgi:hypothetical protein